MEVILKTNIILMALLITFGNISFVYADNPYNVLNNTPVTGTLTVNGTIIEVPPIIGGLHGIIAIPTVKPGETKIAPGKYGDVVIWANAYEVFPITCGDGYVLMVTGDVDVDGDLNDCLITYTYSVSFTEGGIPVHYQLPAPTSNPTFQHTMTEEESDASNGYFELLFRVKSVTANPGAHVGPRVFSFLITAEYPS
jgi:hypothetical protein